MTRLMTHQPELGIQSREIYRYVDDLGNFSDLDLRPFLLPLQEEPTDWKWIYPMAPWGPLSMTDQTERPNKRHTSVIFLNMEFALNRGILSYEWYDKVTTYAESDFPICCYTHWGSALGHRSKVGIITSQVRAIMIASSSAGFCQVSLNKLQVKLESIGYPTGIIQQAVSKTYEALLPLLPIPFSSSRSTGLQPAPLV